MSSQLFPFLRKKNTALAQKEISINKRQRFIISVIILSVGLFISEYFLGKSGFFVALFLSFLTDVFFLTSMNKDLKGNFSWQLLILPFFCTLAFSLFYFLIPARLLTRILLTSIYAVTVYSLFLSQNIFIVASIRTIALLTGARIVSFVITLISFFFLANILFTLKISIFPTAALVFVLSYLLTAQSIWAATLDPSLKRNALWTFALSLCLMQVTIILWFWPSSATVISIFLTGFFYTIVGLSQVWFEKRLFRGVMWEYIWVAVIVFFILVLFTSWRG